MVRQASLAVLVALVAVLGLGQGLGGRYWEPGLGRAEKATLPATGQALLDAFQCPFAETRTVQIRGVEDGFSPSGSETSNPPAWMTDSASKVSLLTAIDYDVAQKDTYVVDSFELDPGTVSGLFVTSVRTLPDDQTDALFIGDLEQFRLESQHRSKPWFSARLQNLDRTPGWSRRGTLIWVPVERILMQLGGHSEYLPLLHTLQSNPEGTKLNIAIHDDTAVDFMALVTCIRPAHSMGYTLRVTKPGLSGLENVVILTGGRSDATDSISNPYVGDTDCDTRLPLMCFRDEKLPAPTGPVGPAPTGPAGSVEHQSWWTWVRDRWSGGSLRATEPVRGRDFMEVGDADKFCARQFGRGWRVADHHLGGGLEYSLAGHGHAPAVDQRFWIDIKDQPYATCWARPTGAP